MQVRSCSQHEQLSTEVKKRLFHLKNELNLAVKAGSDDENFLRSLEQQGVVKFREAEGRTHFYALTASGEEQLYQR